MLITKNDLTFRYRERNLNIGIMFKAGKCGFFIYYVVSLLINNSWNCIVDVDVLEPAN